MQQGKGGLQESLINVLAVKHMFLGLTIRGLDDGWVVKGATPGVMTIVLASARMTLIQIKNSSALIAKRDNHKQIRASYL